MGCLSAGFGARPRSEVGAVTAETAVALPVLVIVAAALGWFLVVGVTQARVDDAARETVRALSRGDSQDSSEGLGRRVAPAGAAFEVHHDGDFVTVTVTAEVPGPGGILGFLPVHQVRAEAAGAVEPGS